MASGQTNKISPRKFSEKIALLNKKEAEGNAEFEEIIKEVQATRSQSACSSLNTSTTTIHKSNIHLATSCGQSRTNTNSNDELQEVYENLIECVGQYEQELQGKQQQQQNQQQCNNLLNDNKDHISSNGHYHSATVAPKSIAPIQTSNIQFLKHLLPTPDTNNTTNSNLSASTSYIPSFQETYVDPFDSQSHNLGVCGQDNNAQCRARVTSVGSADKNNLRQIIEPPRYSSHQDAWIPSSTEMYLKPAYDKSWQKSCSDPALHVGCTPTSGNHQIVSCSDNILTTGDCTDPNIVTKNSTDQVQFVGQLDDNTFLKTLPAQNIACAVDKYDEYTSENNSSIVSNQLKDQQQTGLISTIRSTELIQQAKQQKTKMSKNDNNMHFSTLPEHYQADNSLNVVINDVPGIKICSIEDDAAQSLRSANIASSNHNNLSNLSNSQCNNQCSTYTGCSKQVDSASSITLSNESQFYGEKSVDWSHSQQITPGALASSQQQTDIVFDSKLNHIRLCPETSNNQLPLFDVSSNNDWSDTRVNNPSLNVPKVNNMLSTSDCSLTANCCDHQMSNLNSCNSIIRSHSHNSIDHIRKQKIRNHQNYNHPQAQTFGHYDDHTNQIRLQIGHGGHCCNQSNCSMKPQYGSVSPIDSSSNLTSPQSEQNSPGSTLLLLCCCNSDCSIAFQHDLQH